MAKIRPRAVPWFPSNVVLAPFSHLGYRPAMADRDDNLMPADPKDLADAIAFALRYSGGARVHTADEYMAAIAGERVARHLERAGFVVMKRPAIGGSAGPGPRV